MLLLSFKFRTPFPSCQWVFFYNITGCLRGLFDCAVLFPNKCKFSRNVWFLEWQLLFLCILEDVPKVKKCLCSINSKNSLRNMLPLKQFFWKHKWSRLDLYCIMMLSSFVDKGSSNTIRSFFCADVKYRLLIFLLQTQLLYFPLFYLFWGVLSETKSFFRAH